MNIRTIVGRVDGRGYGYGNTSELNKEQEPDRYRENRNSERKNKIYAEIVGNKLNIKENEYIDSRSRKNQVEGCRNCNCVELGSEIEDPYNIIKTESRRSSVGVRRRNRLIFEIVNKLKEELRIEIINMFREELFSNVREAVREIIGEDIRNRIVESQMNASLR